MRLLVSSRYTAEFIQGHRVNPRVPVNDFRYLPLKVALEIDGHYKIIDTTDDRHVAICRDKESAELVVLALNAWDTR